MRKTRIKYQSYKGYILLLSLLPLLFGCSDRDDNKVTYQTITSINGTLEQTLPDTKTTLGAKVGANIPLYWSTGDQIALFCGTTYTTSHPFDLKVGENTKNGIFDGTIQRAGGDALYAFYPYSANVTISHSPTKITFTLPQEQTYTENNIQNGINPTVAYAATGSDLQFKNLCGILRLKLKVASGTKTIKKITVCANNGYLSGKFTVDPTAAIPAMTRVPGSVSNMIILNLPEAGIELTTEVKEFHIVVPPHATTSTNNLMVWIESNDGKMEKITNTNSILQGHVLSMTAFDYANDSNFPALFIENGVYKGKGITVTGLTIDTSPNQTRIFAPVNCGYEPVDGTYKGYPYGRYFQWGRKYGEGLYYTPPESGIFGNGNNYNDETRATKVNGQVDESYGYNAAYKSDFYANSSDWCNSTESVKNLFWNSIYPEDNTPKKVEKRDPCPPGWRVPTYREMVALRKKGTTWIENGIHGTSSSLKGRYINGFQSLFLPASGLRGYTALLWQRTFEGLYWTSGTTAMTTPPKSFCLRFNKNHYDETVTPETGYGVISDHRGNAYTVRCIKE